MVDFGRLFNAGEIRWTLCGPFLVLLVMRSKQCLLTSRATTGSSAFLAAGYLFYLHDRAVHERFDAIEKRVDEIRKRLAIEY